MLVIWETSYNQGVYGLVANLGSLVVRTLFQPLEDAAFLAFSHGSGKGGKASAQQAQLLSLMVRAVTLLGACMQSVFTTVWLLHVIVLAMTQCALPTRPVHAL